MTRDQESDTAPSPFIRKGGKKAIKLMRLHKGKEVKRRKLPWLESRHKNEYDQAKETRSHRY